MDEVPTAKEISEDGFVQLLLYERKDELNENKIEPIFDETNEETVESSRADLMWQDSKYTNTKSMRWNGFMETIQMSDKYES